MPDTSNLDNQENQDNKAQNETPTGKDQARYSQIWRRIQELKDARASNPFQIETKWKTADTLYQPHRQTVNPKDSEDVWNSQAIAFEKIQTAITLLIEKNPQPIIKARKKAFQHKEDILKAAFKYSWSKGYSDRQWEGFILNSAKYGTGIGRVFRRKFCRNLRDIESIDENGGYVYKKDPTKKYDLDEVIFRTYDNLNCWIDELARPGDPLSAFDWCWREEISASTFDRLYPRSEYPNQKNVKRVKAGSGKQEGESTTDSGTLKVEFYVYESLADEFVIVDANSQTIIEDSPLPYDHKRLSLVTAPWFTRKTDTIYGIGLPEILENDAEMLDRITNMTQKQVELMIEKIFFYTPAAGLSPSPDGKIRLKAGEGVQVSDTNGVKWMDIPGPGQESIQWKDEISDRIDKTTGITKGVTGEVIGDTARETLVNREAGLRRSLTPFMHLKQALDDCVRIYIDMLQQVYVEPIKHEELEAAMEGDEGFLVTANKMNDTGEVLFSLPVEDGYQINEPPEMEGMPMNPMGNQQETQMVNRFRQIPMNLQRDQTGQLIPSEEENQIEVYPDEIRGEFDVSIDIKSIIPETPEAIQQRRMALYPLILESPRGDKDKAIVWLLKAFNEDPDDVLMTQAEFETKKFEAMKAAMQGMGGQEGQPIPQEAGSPMDTVQTMNNNNVPDVVDQGPNPNTFA